MKKKNKKYIILLLSFITVAVAIVLALFFFHLSFISQTSSAFQPYHFPKNIDVTNNSISLEYPTNLELLPSNFSEEIEKNKIDIDSERIGQLLNYGKTVIDLKENSNYLSLISQFSENETPILINDQLLTLIFLSNLDSIRNDYIQNVALKKLNDIKTKINNGIIVNTISPFHQNIVNEIMTSLSLCNVFEIEEKLNSCVNELIQINTQKRNFLNLLGFENFTQSLRILELYQKYNLSKEFLIANTNNLILNDQEVVKKWESGGFTLSREIPPVKKENSQSIEIEIGVNNNLLNTMTAYLNYLTQESRKLNSEDKELINLDMQSLY